jgi:hypothetical protein
MGKVFSKRGMSPLIATLLLIATAVAIGTSIMSWGITLYGEQKIAEPNCKNIKLEINKINNEQQICYDRASNSIEFTVVNKANVDIESFILWIVGTKVYVLNLNEGLKPGYPLKKKIDYDFGTYGNINQVHLIPNVKKSDGEGQITCSDKELVLENIKRC